MGSFLRRLLQPGVSSTRVAGVGGKAHQHATAGRNQVSLRAVPGLSLELGARTPDKQALPPLILSYSPLLFRFHLKKMTSLVEESLHTECTSVSSLCTLA